MPTSTFSIAALTCSVPRNEVPRTEIDRTLAAHGLPRPAFVQLERCNLHLAAAARP